MIYAFASLRSWILQALSHPMSTWMMHDRPSSHRRGRQSLRVLGFRRVLTREQEWLFVACVGFRSPARLIRATAVDALRRWRP